MEKDDINATTETKKFSFKGLKKKDMILLFLAGLLLVVGTVPSLFSKDNSTKEETKYSNENVSSTVVAQDSEDKEYIDYYENKLKKLLEKMEGVGRVEVIITLKTSKEQVVLKDHPYNQQNLNETDNEGGSRINTQVQNDESTVLVNTKSGETIPYVTKEIEAKVEGVVVLAQGGNDAYVASAIVNACEVLFDVPAHKVQVLQMTK